MKRAPRKPNNAPLTLPEYFATIRTSDVWNALQDKRPIVFFVIQKPGLVQHVIVREFLGFPTPSPKTTPTPSEAEASASLTAPDNSPSVPDELPPPDETLPAPGGEEASAHPPQEPAPEPEEDTTPLAVGMRVRFMHRGAEKTGECIAINEQARKVIVQAGEETCVVKPSSEEDPENYLISTPS
jgi:hypothetical protein